MNRLISIWVNLRESLWFVPSLMIVSAVVLALLLIDLDTRVGREPLLTYSLVFGLGADGSRGMLTAIASSMLTVATLAFSLTLNALAQVSNQFTPRIIRNFLRDRANQFVLGYFVSVFVYCLVVLRTIRGGDEGSFVPSVAIITGLVFAFGGVFVLIFFIHHMAESIQVSTIINRIVSETKGSVDRIFPESMGVPADKSDGSTHDLDDYQWVAIPSFASGFLQMVDSEQLLEIARESKLIIRMECRLGDFIGTCAPLVSVAAPDGDGEAAIEDGVAEEINDHFIIGSHRTLTQDVEFGLRQLVDIALKALSPGINDTTTALTCINYISEILGQLADRSFPEKVRTDRGRPLVITKSMNFEEYVSAGFDQIMVSGRGHFAVFERLGSSILYIASRTRDQSRLAALFETFDRVSDFAEESTESTFESEKVKSEVRSMRSRFADRIKKVERGS